MGVKGLDKFLKEKNEIHEVNISSCLTEWKRKNVGQPIVVIDLSGFSIGIARKFSDDFVYGGRHRQMQEYFKNILIKFRETGCKLVFFSDCNIQDNKIIEWLHRRNEEFKNTTKLYEWIGNGKTKQEMAGIPKECKLALKVAVYINSLIAQDFGEIHYAINHECDWEIARYAKHHNAMAIVSSDTDFLIFDGSWELWSCKDIQINQENQIITKRYKKDAILRILRLRKDQLPLFATLVGNDFIKNVYGIELDVFHCDLGERKDKIINVADYVRKLDWNWRDNHFTTESIMKYKIWNTNEIREVIKRSIKSYSIVEKLLEEDLISKKSLDASEYPMIMSRTQGINLDYYDMHACGDELPKLLINWMQRRIGFSWNQNDKKSPEFTLLVTKNLNEGYVNYAVKSIYPSECEIPRLSDFHRNKNVAEIRYKILGWIMSLPNEIICEIKSWKFFIAKRVTLYALVKNGLIDVSQAYGILHTEIRFHTLRRDASKEDVDYPTRIIPKHIRAAHIYNIAFDHVRQNFDISGLLPMRNTMHCDESFYEMASAFDGVYFQYLMEETTPMNLAEKSNFLVSNKQLKKIKTNIYISMRNKDAKISKNIILDSMKESIKMQLNETKAFNDRPSKVNTSTNDGGMAQEHENWTVVDRPKIQAGNPIKMIAMRTR